MQPMRLRLPAQRQPVCAAKVPQKPKRASMRQRSSQAPFVTTGHIKTKKASSSGIAVPRRLSHAAGAVQRERQGRSAYIMKPCGCEERRRRSAARMTSLRVNMPTRRPSSSTTGSRRICERRCANFSPYSANSPVCCPLLRATPCSISHKTCPRIISKCSRSSCCVCQMDAL